MKRARLKRGWANKHLLEPVNENVYYGRHKLEGPPVSIPDEVGFIAFDSTRNKDSTISSETHGITSHSLSDDEFMDIIKKHLEIVGTTLPGIYTLPTEEELNEYRKNETDSET